MGSWHPLPVCQNIHYLYFIPYRPVTWLYWSVVLFTCGIDGSWLLNTPEIIIVGILIGFIFVCLRPISKAHIVSLVPCPCFSFDILVIEESYGALLINLMVIVFISTFSICFFKLEILFGFAASYIISMQWPNFTFSFMEYGSVMEINLIYISFLKTSSLKILWMVSQMW